MSRASPGRLSDRFKRGKFPNPEQSIGRLLQKTGNGLHIWDVRGPAQNALDTLRPEIISHLWTCGSSTYGEVRWTLCMVGRAETSASPTIVVHSPEEEPRRTVKNEIKSSGILKKYPGFITMDCNRPPGMVEVVRLGRGADDMEWNFTQSAAPEQLFSSNIEGARLMVQESGNTEGNMIATAGGVLEWKGRYFIMTAAHIFPGYSEIVFPETKASSEFEYQLDNSGEDEDEDVEDENLEKMSKASMSSPSSFSDDNNSNEMIQSETPEPESLGSTGLFTVDRTDSNLNFSSTSDRRGMSNMELSSIESTKSKGSLILAYDFNPGESLKTTVQLRNGRGISLPSSPIFSDDKQHPILDYALLEVSSQFMEYTNSISNSTSQTIHNSISMEENSFQQIAEFRSVVVTTFSRGSIQGEILAGPTFLRRQNSSDYQELWTVRLETSLEKGDSGSWVRDAAMGKIYGQVIAGSLDTGYAYIIPLDGVIFNLQQRFGGHWLPVGRSLEWETSTYSNGGNSTSSTGPILYQSTDRASENTSIFSFNDKGLYDNALEPTAQNFSPSMTAFPPYSDLYQSGLSGSTYPSRASSFSTSSSSVFSIPDETPLGSVSCPPLSPTESLVRLQTSAGQRLTPNIYGRIDKGFFIADNDWTCYRRNYFSLNCSYVFLPALPSNEPVFLVENDTRGPQVYGYSMSIAAVVDGRDGKAIELVQHAPKRANGPQEKPPRVTLAPRPSMFHGTHGNSDIGVSGQSSNQPAVEATFERIQFKTSTANNGKRRATQQYYHLLIELFADVGSQRSERFVKIAFRMSAPLVVRGRSPGHYQSERIVRTLEHEGMSELTEQPATQSHKSLPTTTLK